MVKVNLSRVRESAREDLCASFGMELESGNKPRFQFQESRVSIRASGTKRRIRFLFDRFVHRRNADISNK